MIRNVVTIQEDALMEDAAMTMLKNDIGCLPVVDANGEISGILTQNDVFNAFWRSSATVKRQPHHHRREG